MFVHIISLSVFVSLSRIFFVSKLEKVCFSPLDL